MSYVYETPEVEGVQTKTKASKAPERMRGYGFIVFPIQMVRKRGSFREREYLSNETEDYKVGEEDGCSLHSLRN